MRSKARAVAVTVNDGDLAHRPAHPFAGNSLVPMLVIGLVLTFAGMIAALVLS